MPRDTVRRTGPGGMDAHTHEDLGDHTSHDHGHSHKINPGAKRTMPAGMDRHTHAVRR